MVQPGHSILYYQPFSIIDILNWRTHIPPYSEKTQAMVDLLEIIFQTHQPTWNDCQQILLTFFNTDQQLQILTEACPWLQGQALRGTLDAEAWAREAAPDAQPTWDFNTAEGQRVLTQYCTALIHRLRTGAKRPTNMSKIVVVIQMPEETPTDFYERLCEIFWVYTPFDPEAPEN
jgi:hypothetical protein